jgi:hypothetical protein
VPTRDAALSIQASQSQCSASRIAIPMLNDSMISLLFCWEFFPRALRLESCLGNW